MKCYIRVSKVGKRVNKRKWCGKLCRTRVSCRRKPACLVAFNNLIEIIAVCGTLNGILLSSPLCGGSWSTRRLTACLSACLSSSHRCCHTSFATVNAPQDPHRWTIGFQHHYYPLTSCSALQPR